MTRYRWDGEQFVNRATGEPMEAVDRICAPRITRDVTYKSPLSGKEITSRSQRREEMKVHNVREVDPGEYTPVYSTKKWAERQRGHHEPRKKPDLGDAPYVRMSRDELPARFRT